MNTDEKNEETEFDDGFLGADIEVEDAAFGSAYAVVQWVNGTPQGKQAGGIAYTGGFFLSAEQGIEPPKGFEPYTLITSEGTEVVGFAIRDLTFSPIRQRRSWLVEPEGATGGLLERFAWSDYESASAVGKPRGQAHIVAGLASLDEPVLLSLRGMTAKSMMGMGRERGIIPQYGQKLVNAAKRIARKGGRKNKSYPLCSFQLTVGPQRDDKGVPVFTKVGSGSNTSQITLPKWLDEPKKLVDKALLTRLYVGHETFATYQDIHREADDWRAAWDADTLARRAANRSGAPAPAAADSKLPGDQEIPF